MANKEHYDKDKAKNKKRNARDFKDLEELQEKKIYNTNKEIQVIYPVKEEEKKWLHLLLSPPPSFLLSSG